MRGARTRRLSDTKQLAWAVWHVAVLQRAQKLPAFDEFTGPLSGPAPAPTRDYLMAKFKQLAAAWTAGAKGKT